MRESAYYGLLKDRHILDGGGLKCRYCGGMDVACYRWGYKRHFVYEIGPCHECHFGEFKIKFPMANIQLSPAWVELSKEDQVSRIDREEEARIARLMADLPRQELQPEEPSEPPEGDVGDDVHEEP